MKRFLIALLLIFIIFPSVYANSTSLYINGNKVDCDMLVQNDRIYVPLRTVSEKLGASVEWDATNNTAQINSVQSDNLLPQIIEQVSPSVVAIIGNYTSSDVPSYKEKYVQSIAHGTGVIIKSGGEILTNAHVVKDLKNIIVVLSDGSSYQGIVKYIDNDTDLAVVKINKIGMQAAQLGDSEDIVIGKSVVAIGTPISFTLRNSATKGIISGLNRNLSTNYRLIQTDASINPGNSGGPLVDMNGKVIGINSAKLSGVGVEGMGFSIPIDTVKYVLSHFDKYGKVRRPYLGAYLDESISAYLGLPSNEGLKVKLIDQNSPAQVCGLKVDDLINGINQNPVHSLVDWNEELKTHLPGDTVSLQITRGNENMEIWVELSEK